ncbi:MAG TPA: sulfatase-like hydrolase/transferase [Pyrinomonadaceae bacterium]|nr:sulfatase-like hydrolase/transferase [Pyrinomonadaceae bacterium]
MRPLGLSLLTLLAVLIPATAPGIVETPGRQISSDNRQKPNVIFILVDDLGYADIGSYGARDIRTPHLDRLAREGVRLTDCYSNGPVCTPTRAALLTGRYQQRVGLEWAIRTGDKEPGLLASETSIARILKGNGYRTALFGKWHLGYKPEHGPNAHGFDEFFGILGGNADMYSHKGDNGEPELYEGTTPTDKPGYLTDLITERAAAYVGRHTREPFFMYVAYNAPHWPFQPPDKPDDIRTRETWGSGTRADYAKMVERVDAGVGQILHALDRHDLARHTLVVFTNDNGGERFSVNAPFAHRKATLWEGGIRVPCLARWPAEIPAGKVSKQPIITMDWTATILAATGTAPPAGSRLDGVNLLPTLRGRAPQIERTFFWRIARDERKQKAVRRGNWKMLRDGGIDLLFDLEKDASERYDVGYQNQDVLNQMRNLLRAWEADIDRTKPPFSVK